MTKKGLKMTFFPIKSQNIAPERTWVSHIPNCALNYDWLHGKGLIFRTLQNSSWDNAKNWKNGEFGEKQKKNLMLRGGFEPSASVTTTFEFSLSAYWAIGAINDFC